MVFMLQYLVIILGVIFSAIFLVFYFYFTRNYKFWHKLGIPYVKPTPFVGNLKDCVLQKVSIGEKLQQIYNENSDKPYVGIFSFDQPSLVIRDRELVKSVLVKDSHNVFVDHVITFNEVLDPIFARGLPFLKGQRWRHIRTNLSPVFTSGKMKKMFYLVNTCGKELVECLDRATVGGSTVDVKETMLRYTTDVIASFAFGINGNSLKDPQAEFSRYMRKLFDFSVQKGLTMLTAFCAPRLTTLLKLKFLDDDTNHYMRKTVWSTVEYREKNGVVRKDALDSLMQLRNREMKECSENVLSAKNETTDVTFS